MLRLSSLILLVFSISMSVFGQSKPIKRKYRGIYIGQIPTYEVKLGTTNYQVSAALMKVSLDRDSIYLEIGTYRYAAPYNLEQSKETLTLTSNRENSGIIEQLTLDPKTKTLIRKGLYPQPDATLTRSGKLPRR